MDQIKKTIILSNVLSGYKQIRDRDNLQNIAQYPGTWNISCPTSFDLGKTVPRQSEIFLLSPKHLHC